MTREVLEKLTTANQTLNLVHTSGDDTLVMTQGLLQLRDAINTTAAVIREAEAKAAAAASQTAQE